MKKCFQTSVIIPSYNSIKTIPTTIEKLFEMHNFGCILEIIIVDSSDDCITKEYLNSIHEEKIRIITSGIKVMPAIQRNIGAEQAKGDLLIFIDSDAYPSKDWLVKILAAYSEGWLAGGGSYLIPEFQKSSNIALAQYYFEFGEFLPFGKTRIRNILPACNLFCDRTFFLTIGGFPNIRASEDGLFCLTASKQLKLVFIPDAYVYHIFRENKNDFLSNQFLQGKHIFIFHRNYHNSIYLRSHMFYLLAPLFLIYKFVLRFSLILKLDRSHFKPFLKSFRYFWMANLAWFNGFIDGKNYPINEEIVNRRQLITNLSINEIRNT